MNCEMCDAKLEEIDKLSEMLLPKRRWSVVEPDREMIVCGRCHMLVKINNVLESIERKLDYVRLK